MKENRFYIYIYILFENKVEGADSNFEHVIKNKMFLVPLPFVEQIQIS